MKKVDPSIRPDKDVINRGGHALICKHEDNQKHKWFWDGRIFGPAQNPNLQVSRPVSSVSSHPNSAVMKERLRAKRWGSDVDSASTKKPKFETPDDEPPPSPPPLPPPRSKDKKKTKSRVPASDGYVNLPKYIPRPLDSGWSYAIAVSSFSGYAIVDGTIHSFSPFLTPFAEYYTASIAKVSWISSVMIGSYMWTGIVATELTNKFGCRAVCVGGAVIASGAYVSTVFSSSSYFLIGTQGVIAGIGFGCIFIPSAVSVGNYFEKNRATASGLISTGTGVGTTVFPPVANYLIERLGWKGANLIIALVVLVVGLIMGFLMRPLEVPKMKKQYLYDNLESLYNKRVSNDDEDRCEICGKVLEPSSNVANNKNSYQNVLEYFKNEKSSSADTNDGNYEMNHFQKNPYHDCSGEPDKKNLYFLDYNDDEEKLLSGLKVVPTTDESNFFKSLGSFCCCSSTRKKYISVDPLARHDVFYTGNISNLKEFDDNHRLMPDYRWATNRFPNIKYILSNLVFGKSKSGSKENWCDKVGKIIDFRLLKNPLISLLLAANFAGVLGAYVPFAFYRDAAIDKGLDKVNATILVSCMGVPNIIEGFLSGQLSKLTHANSYALWCNVVSISLAALCMVLTPVAYTQTDLIIVALFYGMFIFVYFSLTTLILVEAHVLKDLTAAYKLMLLFKGAAASVGTPIAGYIHDSTKSYDGSFYFSGVALFISALLHMLVAFLSRNNESKDNRFRRMNDDEDDEESIAVRRKKIQENYFKKIITVDSGQAKKNADNWLSGDLNKNLPNDNQDYWLSGDLNKNVHNDNQKNLQQTDNYQLHLQDLEDDSAVNIGYEAPNESEEEAEEMDDRI